MKESIELPLEILLAEDSKFFSRKVEKSLCKLCPNAEVSHAGSLNQIDEMLSEDTYDVLILDLMFPGGSSLSKIKRLKVNHPDMFIIVSSGQSDVRTAIKSIKDGADHYIVKDDGFNSDLFLSLNSISQSVKTRNQLKFMINQVFDEEKYPMLLMKASEMGVSEVYRDFEKFPEEIRDMKAFIQKIGLSVIVSLGQGDVYHEGIYRFPAVESKFYSIIDFAFRLKDSEAADRRLRVGYFHLIFFIPNSFISMFPAEDKLSHYIDMIKDILEDGSEITGEKLNRIKMELFDQLRKIALDTKN